MNKLENEIKNLPEIELPAQLHGKIMRRVFVRRFHLVFAVIAAVVILNLGLAGWRIGTKITETEAISAFRIVIGGFEPGYDSISDLIEMTADYLPLFSVAAFLINLVLAFYLAVVYLDFHKYERFRFEKGREIIFK